MKKVSPAVIGAFVLGAFTLGILALLFFGGVNFFRQQQRFVVYFDESIQGLNLGSPVKLRGVAIGRVVDLHVRYNPAKNGSVVAVVCELNRNMVTDDKGAMIDVSNRAQLQSLVDHGLRAQLDVVGLATGLVIVELDFYDPQRYPPQPGAFENKYPVVPPVPSTISEIQALAMEILQKVDKVDFEGLAGDFKSLLADARTRIDSVDLKGLAVQWQHTGAAVEDLARSSEIKQTLANLNLTLLNLQTTLGDLHHTLANVDGQVATSGTELRTALLRAQEAMQQFNGTAATLRRFIEAQQNLGDDTHHALTQFADAAEAVQRLADFLERNPSALISGRKPPQ
jgi:paraquat-inducible protein B